MLELDNRLHLKGLSVGFRELMEHFQAGFDLCYPCDIIAFKFEHYLEDFHFNFSFAAAFLKLKGQGVDFH